MLGCTAVAQTAHLDLWDCLIWQKVKITIGREDKGNEWKTLMLLQPFRNPKFLHAVCPGIHILTFGISYCTDAVEWVELSRTDSDVITKWHKLWISSRRGINKDNLLKNNMQILMDRFFLACLCHVSQHVCFLCDQLYSQSHSNTKSVCLTLPNTNKKITAIANICSQSWCFIHWTSVPLGISLKLHSPNKNYSIKLCKIDWQIFTAFISFSPFFGAA